MPRRVDNVKIQFQLPREIVDEMRRLIPEIIDPVNPSVFRWGGLQKYFQAIIITDLAARRKRFDAQAKIQTKP